MKKVLLIFVAALGFSSITACNLKAEAANQRLKILNNEYSYIIDFSDFKEANNWQSTNDGVMGGVSQGQLFFSNNACVFAGNISLENNGGFSSVYKKIQPLPEGLDTVDIEIVGDGSVYQLRMVVYVNGYRLAYKHEFRTVAGKKERIKLKLNDFQASFRGRIIQDAPKLKSENIRETGFLLTKKVQGSFSITLYNLEIYANTEA